MSAPAPCGPGPQWQPETADSFRRPIRGQYLLRRTGHHRSDQSPGGCGLMAMDGRYHAGRCITSRCFPTEWSGYNGAPGGTSRRAARHARARLLPSAAGRRGRRRSRRIRRQERSTVSRITPSRSKTTSAYYQRRRPGVEDRGDRREEGKLDVAPTGKLVKDGINGKYTFDIDSVTRVWKERRLSIWTDLAPGADGPVEPQLVPGLRETRSSPSPTFGSMRRAASSPRNCSGAGMCAISSSAGCRAGSITSNISITAARSITITLFGGMDPSLYADMKATRETGLLGRRGREDLADLVPSQRTGKSAGCWSGKRSRTRPWAAAAFNCA